MRVNKMLDQFNNVIGKVSYILVSKINTVNFRMFGKVSSKSNYKLIKFIHCHYHYNAWINEEIPPQCRINF